MLTTVISVLDGFHGKTLSIKFLNNFIIYIANTFILYSKHIQKDVFCYFVVSHVIFECPAIGFQSKICPHYLDNNQ